MRGIWIVSLTVPLALCGCKDRTPLRQQARPYAMRRVQEPLSSEDIRSALDVLGLQIERFDCYVPEPGRLRLLVRRYVDGTFMDTAGNSTIGLQAGEQRFLLYAQKQNASVSFSFASNGGRVSWGQIDTSGYTAWTSGSLAPQKLERDQEVPLYAYAAARGSLAGLTPRPVEQLVAEYPLAIVVFAELRENEGQ